MGRPLKEDLTGRRFSSLVVLGRGTLDKHRRFRWLCQCDCGNTKQILSGDLTRWNGVRSCGCKWRSAKRGRPISQEVGKTYNKLTVQEFAGTNNFGNSLWRCSCECGGEIVISQSRLAMSRFANCRDKTKHSVLGNWYPETPNPYPAGAGEIAEKHLYLTKRFNGTGDAESIAIDSLMRASWICWYRRNWGKPLPSETNYIAKWIRFSRLIWLRNKRIEQGKMSRSIIINRSLKKGCEMTDLTFPNYPVEATQETQGNPVVRKHKIFFRRR